MQSGHLDLHWEVVVHAAPKLFDRARQIGRLACVARGFQRCLSGGGKLRVGIIETSCIQSLLEGLVRVAVSEMEVLRVDFSGESRQFLSRQEIERALRHLSDCLHSASSLRVLSVRMASFDAAMERLRLSSTAWETLIHGLSAVARHQRLQSLELTSFAIKEGGRQLRRARSAPEREPGSGEVAGKPSKSFTEALSQISSLEELCLTSDAIFPPTAQLLAQALPQLKQLVKVDLTRNHISKQAMESIRQALPDKVELRGNKQQTVCC